MYNKIGSRSVQGTEAHAKRTHTERGKAHIILQYSIGINFIWMIVCYALTALTAATDIDLTQ